MAPVTARSTCKSRARRGRSSASTAPLSITPALTQKPLFIASMKAAFAAGRDLGDLDGEARAGASDQANAILGECNRILRLCLLLQR